MYQVAAFSEKRVEVMHALMRARPLATLAVVVNGAPEVHHLPLLLDDQSGPWGSLRGHVARANPLWRQAQGASLQALAVFHGPQTYVTPSWYATKRETGAVVPTWNYAVVHARGELKVHDDRGWVRELVTRLTQSQEAAFPQPWSIDDAPPEYIERMLGAIVGIELPIAELLGKWKASQNRSDADRSGVAEGLGQLDEPQAQAMADLVAERAAPKRLV